MSTVTRVTDEGKGAYLAIQDVVKEVRKIQHELETNPDNAASLPERIKAAAAISRVYISDRLGGEDITIPLLGVLNQMYIAYLITALGLEQSVDGARTVGSITRKLSTESLLQADDLIRDQFSQYEGSTEAVKSGTVQLTDSEQHLITGRVIEVEFGTGKQSIPIRMFVQLIPRLIDPDVSSKFVDVMIGGSASLRFKKALAGEIRMVRDFFMAMDRIRDYRKALKKDKSGDLANMLGKQNNALAKHWINKTAGDVNHNTASSVLVIDRESFDKALQDSGMKFDGKTKARFFKESAMMMLVIVDTDYNIVEIHANGIEGNGDYTFQQIEKVGASKKGGMDLKDVMAVFGRGNMSRM